MSILAHLAVALALVGVPQATYSKENTMKIESSVFTNGKPIPPKHTCQGKDVSPPLTFSNIPKEARSLALIMDDPDAPHGTFDHWIAWNIPANTTALSEGVTLAHQGTNHFQEARYRGPCPPPGKPHRYFFKLYALDTTLNLPNGSTKEAVEAAMEGHILAKAELVGLFQR